MRRPRVVVLEFNELCPGLMKAFIADGKLPSFQRLYQESGIYLTESDQDAPYLEPWIQWITVHSGVPYERHRILDLGDGDKLEEKNVWDLLSDSGYKVWICGSMNLRYRQPIRGWVLPDPWTTRVPAHPSRELEAYRRFMAVNVTEHTAERLPLTAGAVLQFVAFMLRHGLSLATVRAIAGQLVSERFGSQPSRWKRPVLLDKLQFDLFDWVYRKERPDFSTFFLNSTAHFQHRYWRNMEPERFTLKPAPDEPASFEQAILYGYQQMDELVGRFLDLAGEDTTLVFCTALSQQPCLSYEEVGGKTMYRPRDFARFLLELGVTSPARVSPVMAQQFHLDFETEEAAKDAEARLQALEYAGGPALMVGRTGERIFAGCQVHQPVPPEATLKVALTGRETPFFRLFYHVDLLKSGMHHPDGMLWIRTPKRQHWVHPGKVPLVSVAPTLLGLFGVGRPAFMKGDPISLGCDRAA